MGGGGAWMWITGASGGPRARGWTRRSVLVPTSGQTWTNATHTSVLVPTSGQTWTHATHTIGTQRSRLAYDTHQLLEYLEPEVGGADGEKDS